MPAFGPPTPPRSATRRAATVEGAEIAADHRQLRGQAHPLPRRVDRRAGRQRHRQRPGGGRGAPLGAHAAADPRGGAHRRGPAAPRSRRSPGPRRRPASRRRRRHQGGRARPRRPDVRDTTGIGRVDPRASLSPAASRPATGCSSRARSATTGRRSCSPAASSSSTPSRSDTRSLWPAVDAMLAAAGPALRCLRDATRGGVASVLTSSPARRAWRCSCARRDVPVAPAVGAPPRSSASTRCTWPTRACWWPSSPRRRPRGPGDACARAGRRGAAEIGEVRTEPPGMVLVQTAFGGRRVMDQLVGDPLPRIC